MIGSSSRMVDIYKTLSRVAPTDATVFISGANRGIGLEHVRQALKCGDQVIAGARRPASSDDLGALAREFGAALRVDGGVVRSIG